MNDKTTPAPEAAADDGPMSLVKAIFPKDCEIRGEKVNASWSIKGSDKPQSFPRACIEAAEAKQLCTRVKK